MGAMAACDKKPRRTEGPSERELTGRKIKKKKKLGKEWGKKKAFGMKSKNREMPRGKI